MLDGFQLRVEQLDASVESTDSWFRQVVVTDPCRPRPIQNRSTRASACPYSSVTPPKRHALNQVAM
jgi:hypothetical protein